MVGVRATDAAASVIPQHLADLAPIDDVRGTGAYRRDAALTLLQRAIAQAVDARTSRTKHIWVTRQTWPQAWRLQSTAQVYS